jgi:hypothetical protein
MKTQRHDCVFFNLFRDNVAGQFVVVLLFNTTIALLLSVLSGGLTNGAILKVKLIYSHAIGLSAFITVRLLAYRGTEGPKLRGMALGVTVGAVMGSLIGGGLTGNLLSGGAVALLVNVALGLLFGTVIGYYFISSYRISQAKLVLREQENRQLSAEKQLAENRLRLLQAQIEPHFLFNTLSNIHGLIELDPQRASHTLESLSDYLRASLQRSRQGETTLEDELRLIAAYLDIQHTRMGDRLRYDIDAPEDVRKLFCPPMLIQPLVENAVLHGIEPSMEGGMVELEVMRNNRNLRIEVRDDGLGLGGNEGGLGLALENIRKRLHALYGNSGTLELSRRDPKGVMAVLELPLGTMDE